MNTAFVIPGIFSRESIPYAMDARQKIAGMTGSGAVHRQASTGAVPWKRDHTNRSS